MKKSKIVMHSLQLKFIAFFFFVVASSSILAFIVTLWLLPIDLTVLQNINEILLSQTKGTFHLYNALSMLFAVLIATVFVTIVARRILRPIRTLNAATKKVSQGDFSVVIPCDERFEDELTLLTHNFNQMAQELNKTNGLHQDFIQNVSHEFKTPIASIHGFANLLQQTPLTPQQQEYADIIQKEAKRLSQLASNVLLLSKLENQVIVPDCTWFSLDEQLRHVLVLLQQQWEAKSLEIDLQIDEIKIFANQELLFQVWLNLLDNAIKYSNPNSTIRIVSFVRKNNAVVAIQDFGIGMSEETQAHMFEQFYQADPSRSHAGNGLGLPLVRRIIELSKGAFEVNSILGVGTTITLSLPIQPQ
ncbi:MAG: ATP-binding protein [Erysipelotrichaceae bacterium]